MVGLGGVVGVEAVMMVDLGSGSSGMTVGFLGRHGSWIVEDLGRIGK